MRTTTTTTTKQQQQQQQKQSNNNKKQQQQEATTTKQRQNKNNNQQQQKQQELCHDCVSLFLFGGVRPPQPPPFFGLASSQTFMYKRHQKVIIFVALLKVSSLQPSLFQKKRLPPIFSGNAIKIGVLEDFEKPVFCFGKNGGTTSCPFSRPPIFWVLLFLAFFFFFFCSVSSASSNRVCQKNHIFTGFFAHPSKASSDIMQQQ